MPITFKRLYRLVRSKNYKHIRIVKNFRLLDHLASLFCGPLQIDKYLKYIHKALLVLKLLALQKRYKRISPLSLQPVSIAELNKEVQPTLSKMPGPGNKNIQINIVSRHNNSCLFQKTKSAPNVANPATAARKAKKNASATFANPSKKRNNESENDHYAD